MHGAITFYLEHQDAADRQFAEGQRQFEAQRAVAQAAEPERYAALHWRLAEARVAYCVPLDRFVKSDSDGEASRRVRFQCDANLNRWIVQGRVRRHPTIHAVRMVSQIIAGRNLCSFQLDIELRWQRQIPPGRLIWLRHPVPFSHIVDDGGLYL